MTVKVTLKLFYIPIFLALIFSYSSAEELNVENEIIKNLRITKSAKGWNVEVVRNDKNGIDTVFINPAGRKLNVGEILIPEESQITSYLAIAEDKSKSYKFLVLYACSSIPDWMYVFHLKSNGNIRSFICVDSWCSWRTESTPEEIYDKLFIDSDKDGFPELIDNEVRSRSGGRIIYHKFDGKHFVSQ